jgi:hypothetical protein
MSGASVGNVRQFPASRMFERTRAFTEGSHPESLMFAMQRICGLLAFRADELTVDSCRGESGTILLTHGNVCVRIEVVRCYGAEPLCLADLHRGKVDQDVRFAAIRLKAQDILKYPAIMTHVVWAMVSSTAGNIRS